MTNQHHYEFVSLEQLLEQIRGLYALQVIVIDDLKEKLESKENDVYERWYKELKKQLPDILGHFRTKELLEEIENG